MKKYIVFSASEENLYELQEEKFDTLDEARNKFKEYFSEGFYGEPDETCTHVQYEGVDDYMHYVGYAEEGSKMEIVFKAQVDALRERIEYLAFG